MQHQAVFQNMGRSGGLRVALKYYSLFMLFAHGSDAIARNLVGSSQGALQQQAEEGDAASLAARVNVPSFLLGEEQHEQQQQPDQQVESSNSEPGLSVQNMVEEGEAEALLALKQKVERGDIPQNQLRGAVKEAYAAFIQETDKELKHLEKVVTALENGDEESLSLLQDEETADDQREEAASGAETTAAADDDDDADEDDGLNGPKTESLWKDARDSAHETAEELKDRAREWGERISTLASSAGRDVKKGARKMRDKIVGGVKDAIKKTRERFGKFLKNLGSQVSGGVPSEEATDAAATEEDGERGSRTEGEAPVAGGGKEEEETGTAAGAEGGDEHLKEKLFGGGLHPPSSDDSSATAEDDRRSKEADTSEGLKLEDALDGEAGEQQEKTETDTRTQHADASSGGKTN